MLSELASPRAEASRGWRLRYGYQVLRRADAMLRRLRQSRLDNSRDAEMASLSSVDLLIIDDFARVDEQEEEAGLAMFDDVRWRRARWTCEERRSTSMTARRTCPRQKPNVTSPPPSAPQPKVHSHPRARRREIELGDVGGEEQHRDRRRRRHRGGPMIQQETSSGRSAPLLEALDAEAASPGYQRVTPRLSPAP
ncbi:MAG: hypothetical protein U0324_10260 [Polyangiales bacterium]